MSIYTCKLLSNKRLIFTQRDKGEEPTAPPPCSMGVS